MIANKYLFIAFDDESYCYHKARLKGNKSAVLRIGYLNNVFYSIESGELEIDVGINISVDGLSSQLEKSGILYAYSNLIYANFYRPVAYVLSVLSEVIGEYSHVYIDSSYIKGYYPLASGEGDNVKTLFWSSADFYGSIVGDSIKHLRKEVVYLKGSRVKSFLYSSAIRKYVVGAAKSAVFGLTSVRIGGEGRRLYIIRNARSYGLYNASGDGQYIYISQLNESLKAETIIKKIPKILSTLTDFTRSCISFRSHVKGDLLIMGGGLKLSIPKSKLSKIISLEFYDKYLYRKALEKSLTGLELDEIHTYEMINPTAFIDNAVAQSKGVRFCIHQSATLDYRRIVQYPDFDEFTASSKYDQMHVLDSVKDKDVLIAKSFSNGPLNKKKEIHCDEKGLKRVVYFTQPFPMKLEDNYRIIEYLSDLAKKESFQFMIRPHPRDLSDYLGKYPDIGILNDPDSKEDFYGADLVVSRTSRVLYDALIKGVPYLSLLLNPKDRDLATVYLCEELELIRIYELEKLGDVINFDRYCAFEADYYRHRELVLGRYF